MKVIRAEPQASLPGVPLDFKSMPVGLSVGQIPLFANEHSKDSINIHIYV